MLFGGYSRNVLGAGAILSLWMNKYQFNNEITIPCHGHEKKKVGMVQKCEKKR